MMCVFLARCLIIGVRRFCPETTLQYWLAMFFAILATHAHAQSLNNSKSMLLPDELRLRELCLSNQYSCEMNAWHAACHKTWSVRFGAEFNIDETPFITPGKPSGIRYTVKDKSENRKMEGSCLVPLYCTYQFPLKEKSPQNLYYVTHAGSRKLVINEINLFKYAEKQKWLGSSFIQNSGARHRWIINPMKFSTQCKIEKINRTKALGNPTDAKQPEGSTSDTNPKNSSSPGGKSREDSEPATSNKKPQQEVPVDSRSPASTDLPEAPAQKSNRKGGSRTNTTPTTVRNKGQSEQRSRDVDQTKKRSEKGAGDKSTPQQETERTFIKDLLNRIPVILIALVILSVGFIAGIFMKSINIQLPGNANNSTDELFNMTKEPKQDPGILHTKVFSSNQPHLRGVKETPRDIATTARDLSQLYRYMWNIYDAIDAKDLKYSRVRMVKEASVQNVSLVQLLEFAQRIIEDVGQFAKTSRQRLNEKDKKYTIEYDRQEDEYMQKLGNLSRKLENVSSELIKQKDQYEHLQEKSNAIVAKADEKFELAERKNAQAQQTRVAANNIMLQLQGELPEFMALPLSNGEQRRTLIEQLAYYDTMSVNTVSLTTALRNYADIVANNDSAFDLIKVLQFIGRRLFKVLDELEMQDEQKRDEANLWIKAVNDTLNGEYRVFAPHKGSPFDKEVMSGPPNTVSTVSSVVVWGLRDKRYEVIRRAIVR